MGDFAGGMLKYLKTHPVERVTIAGGFAKLTKLAQGALDLHSARSTVDLGRLAEMAGGNARLGTAIRGANTANEALELAGDGLAQAVAEAARETALRVLGGATSVQILITDRTGKIVAEAG
jgi:cobalt-precorrin-5B (C1)-methyltransferase